MSEPHGLHILPVLFTVGLLSVFIKTMEGSDCVFDKVQPSQVPSTFVQYHNLAKHRHKRDLADLYQPIRIHVEFHDLGSELAATQQENLRGVVKETIEHVTGIFKVFPVKDRLLLGRSFSQACKNKIVSGINAGKCYTMKGSYDGEYCLDWFKIPDDHLDGFYLYNTTRLDPVKEIYTPGGGVPATDYILYVRALTSQICIKQGLSTIAYASYCQLDQTDRPIAGYINFCPIFFRDHSYNRDKARLTALHELFHALGFASDLFPKFKECQLSDDGVSCKTRHSPVREVFGVPRLVTPCAVNLTSEHFKCRSHPTENEFGPILQIENGKGGSHWDSAFMYGSLMTAKIGLPHLTILDPFTLAAFEDSGWYKVDFNYAESFLWGKDGGCQFGLTEGCQKPGSLYYCLGSSPGCHFLHYDKAVCETDQSLHGCRVYKAKPQDTCLHLTNSSSTKELNYTGEVYGLNSRCFVSNLTKSKELLPVVDVLPVGRCYQTLCNDTGVYIQVHNGPHYLCPWGLTIQIPGYGGSIQCPQETVMCLETKTTVIPEPEPTPDIIEGHPINRADTMGKVCIDIQYGKSTYDLVHLDSRLFQQCNLDVILKITAVNPRRLEEYQVVQGYDNRAMFRFNLLPAKYSDQGPLSEEAITSLERSVNLGNFTFVIPPNGPKYTATSMAVLNVGPKVVDSHLPNFVIIGAILGAIGVIAIIILLVFFLRRTLYHPSNDRELNMTVRRPDQTQLTRSDTESQRSESISRRFGSSPGLRNGSLASHTRQNSYSSSFQFPSNDRQTLPAHAGINEDSARLEMYTHHYQNHEQSDTYNVQGHINAAFQMIESPSRSPVQNNNQHNVMSIAIV